MQLAAGYAHTCAVNTASELACWGCGDGRIEQAPGYPDHEKCAYYDLKQSQVPPAAATGMASVAAGKLFSCGITKSVGKLICW